MSEMVDRITEAMNRSEVDWRDIGDRIMEWGE